MFKKTLLSIAAIIIFLFFTLLLVELVVRLTSNLELKYNFKNWYEQDNKPGPPAPYRVSASIGLGYEISPNACAFINKHGMIGKGYDLEKDKRCFRIIVLGDSITEQHWYVERLEELLNIGKKNNYRFELWNAGVGGYSIVQYYYSLRDKLLRYQPDMIIVGLSLNDFDTRMVVCLKDSEKGIIKYYLPLFGRWGLIKPNQFLLRRSYFYRLLIFKIDEWLCRQDKKIGGEYYLAKIKDICERHKIPLVCFVFPYLKPYKEYNGCEKQNSKAILNALDNLKIDYMDLALFFPEEKRNSLRHQEDRGDYVHPNKDGHRIAAEAMYKYIDSNYFKDNYYVGFKNNE
jgi:hypothetical protein